MPRRPAISKSSFIRGRQCLKSLYLAKKHPELQDPLSEDQRAVFARGHQVGELAQQLFPGGSLAAYDLPKGFMKSMYRTRTLLEEGHTILYEAGFMVNGTHCFIDILVKEGDRWKIYEVKSSTRITETYLYDAAFQYHVATVAGLTIADVSIIHINNTYVRLGELDIHELFTVESVMDQVKGLQDEVRALLDKQAGTLSSPQVPAIAIGTHCFDPYDCDFMGYCWQEVPDYSIFDIARLSMDRKLELYNRGILTPADVPPDFPLNETQRIQVHADKTGETIVDPEGLQSFVESLSYPLYFLDFETFNPAIPLYNRSRPYQQLVFQYSLHHREGAGGPLKHMEFLAQPVSDPRIQVLEQLVSDLGSEGSILVYNMGFESGRLKEIARDFPRFELAVEQVIERMVDLMVPFQQKLLYLPEMKGSYSIKYVLPALLPELRYDFLEISSGSDASLAYYRLFDETDPLNRQAIRDQLLEYCRMDTFAMVEILRVLEQMIKQNTT